MAKNLDLRATHSGRGEPAFLMTPEQCLAHAAAWRTAGNEYLAKQFQNLWQARIVRRMKEAPERVPESPSPSIARQA